MRQAAIPLPSPTNHIMAAPSPVLARFSLRARCCFGVHFNIPGIADAARGGEASLFRLPSTSASVTRRARPPDMEGLEARFLEKPVLYAASVALRHLDPNQGPLRKPSSTRRKSPSGSVLEFVLLDCGGDHPHGAFKAAREGNGGIIVGYNALHEGTLWSGLRAHFLPIGEGLMVIRIAKGANADSGGGSRCCTVDDCIVKSNVFKIISPLRR